jgi:CIC family chloride channel protein
MKGRNWKASWSIVQSTFRFLNISYLQKWTFFGIIIGIIAGAAAVGVSALTDLLNDIFLGIGAGFFSPVPGDQATEFDFVIERPWLLPILTGLGGLIVGLLFYRVQPAGEGHGTDAVIDAFHNKKGNISPRIPFLTALASPITIGSGGSGGLEGPMSHIGAGLSSILGRLFKFDADDRRIALAAGLAAGISSIFKVPLGAALFSTEVFYKRDFEVKALVPSVIASVAGYTVVGFVLGWAPLFSLPGDIARYSRPESLLMYGIVGIVSAGASMAYVRIFHFTSSAFAKLRVPSYAKPAIGGTAVGAIAIIAPQVLGNSYGWLQLAMFQSPLLMPLWIILAIVILKIIATSLTIGSGGSAGVFAPTMAIGGLLGAFMGGLFHVFGLFLWIDVSAVAIVGMVAFFSATAKTPIATIIMGSELTGGYGLLAPMMIATVVAYAVSSLNSGIFKSQVTTRRESPVHKGEYDISILKELRASDAADTCVVLDSSTPITDAVEAMQAGEAGIAFVNMHDNGTGMTTLNDVLTAQKAGDILLVSAKMRKIAVIKDSDLLLDAYNLLASTGEDVIAVTSQGRIIGKISYKSVARAYHDQVNAK